MQNQLDSKELLSKYQFIVDHGRCRDGVYFYQGLHAWHDSDGYTVFVGNGVVTITLLFHGKYHADYPTQSDFNDFLAQLKKLA